MMTEGFVTTTEEISTTKKKMEKKDGKSFKLIYTKHTYYICKIIGEVCGGSVDSMRGPPNCKDCEDYINWKKSGKTVEEYERSNE